MSENTWPNPDRPGIPLNPERDGWHWLKTGHGVAPWLWRDDPQALTWGMGWETNEEVFAPGDIARVPGTIYLGPVLTPDETAALQKRCEEAERERDALRRDTSQQVTTDEMVRRLQHLGDWQAADRIEALQKRVAELEGALRFYADPFKYTDIHGDDVRVPHFYSETDFGETARVALEGKEDE